MEIKLMYPKTIPYALIIAAILLFAWRKRKKYKKGVVVANTKYIKRAKLFKILNLKYLIYNILIIVVCFGLIGLAATITARIYKEDSHEETKEYYNRDIILCLDFSGSMGGVINKIIGQYVQIVQGLNGDRFGIVVFGGAPSTILPLTDDYDYAISVLNKLRNSNTMDIWRWSGMMAYSCCSSSDGDGLAASILNFDKDDGRTKLVVLAADHGVGSNYIVSLNEAAEIAKDYGVKVYYVDGEGSSSLYGSMADKKNAASITNGKYYNANSLSVSQIINDIDNLDKTLLVEKNVETTKIDLPEMLFPYLFYLTILLFLLDWRVRI